MEPAPPTLGLDADDTLWHNENIFALVHERYRALLGAYHPAEVVDASLLAAERRNLEAYGYGIKGFTLSAIETAIELTGERITAGEIRRILQLGREMHAHPVDLLHGVAEVLAALARDFPLLLITKGDLRDQERKLRASGLRPFFRAVEIVAEKDEATYAAILQRHGIAPADFFMIGNSLKSDILPVLALGGAGAHVPYPILWALEHAPDPVDGAGRFFPVGHFREVPGAVAAWVAARRAAVGPGAGTGALPRGML